MIKEALAAYAKASQRPWAHDRSQSIGASEIGQCVRKNWFAKHGSPPDPAYADRWGAKKRGDLIEAFWVKALRHHLGKGTLHYAGQYQRTFIDPVSRLSATPDGLIKTDTECFTVECKSIDPRAKIEEAKPEHLFQCQVQMGLVRQLTHYEPTHAILCYIDASFLDESREFKITFNPAIFEEAKRRAAAIYAANNADALRPEGYIAGGAECEYCAWRGSCSAMRAGQVPKQQEPVDEATVKRLALVAEDRAEFKAAVGRLEQQVRDCEQEIKDIMSACGTRRVNAGGISISWSALKGRPSWDWPGLRAAAEEAGLDLSEFETTGDPSDRLQIRLGAAVKEAAE
jgi:CRISPR/Cas system-associated exonuclease Cas4 (RecB family)